MELKFTDRNELWRSDRYRLYSGSSSLQSDYLQPLAKGDNKLTLVY